MTSAKSAMANRVTCEARLNVSHETREVSIVDVQPAHTRPLPQLQVTGSSQQPVRRNRNAGRRQRRRARQLQTQEAETTICPAIYPMDIEREAQARVSSEPRQTRESAFRDLNAKLRRLAFLKLHFPNATFSNVRSVPLLRDTRLVSLQLNAGPRRPAFLKRR